MEATMKYVALLACGFALLAAPQKNEDPERWLETAMQAETVDGDLKTAIEQYKKIIGKVHASREVVAKALVRLGMCYERQGNAEARKQYERVVRDYVDQTEAVAQARMRLGNRFAGAQGPRPVWTGPFVDNRVSLSGDGRYLSYVGEKQALVVRDLVSGTDRVIVSERRGRDDLLRAPISQDGRQIADTVIVGDHFELRVMPLGGSAAQPRVLSREIAGADAGIRGGYGPLAWTPDGQQLLAYHGGYGKWEVGMVSIKDGSFRVLKAGPDIDRNPKLSPDGRWIAYGVPNGMRAMPTAGGPEIEVIHEQAAHGPMGWSPDGLRLYFLSNRTTAVNSLWSIGFESGRPKGAPELVKADTGLIAPVGITRTGALFYRKDILQRSDIYSAELGPGVEVNKVALATARSLHLNQGSVLSPDGKSLAYYSKGPGGAIRTLVIRTLETGAERDVPINMLTGYPGPRWFPDSRSVLAGLRASEGAPVAPYKIDLASGKPEPLCDPCQGSEWGHWGAWPSPDGKGIFYSNLNNATDQGAGEHLVRYDIETHKETELLRREGHFMVLAVSPNGMELAVVVNLSYGPPLRDKLVGVMPISGGSFREVFRAPDLSTGALTWTPDQKYLLVVRGRTGVDRSDTLWRVPVNGGEAEPMGLSRPAFIGWPQVHPDGKKFFFTTVEPNSSEVWAMEDLAPKTVARK
jgi:Tol biopolymer transport system component